MRSTPSHLSLTPSLTHTHTPSWRMLDVALFDLHTHTKYHDCCVRSHDIPHPPCRRESPMMVLLQKWQVTDACLCGLNDASRTLRWLSNTALQGLSHMTVTCNQQQPPPTLTRVRGYPTASLNYECGYSILMFITDNIL